MSATRAYNATEYSIITETVFISGGMRVQSKKDYTWRRKKKSSKTFHCNGRCKDAMCSSKVLEKKINSNITLITKVRANCLINITFIKKVKFEPPSHAFWPLLQCSPEPLLGNFYYCQLAKCRRNKMTVIRNSTCLLLDIRS